MKTISYLCYSLVFVLFFTACETDTSDLELEDALKITNVKKQMKLVGYDDWGFNFEAQHFNGFLINMILGDPAFANEAFHRKLIYKEEGQIFWKTLPNEYSNLFNYMPLELLDCKLRSDWNEGIMGKDGVYPDTWVDSNGEITFKYSMTDDTGKRWSHFRKLVSSRTTDELINGLWYNEEGQEIGFQSWWWPTLIVVEVVNTGTPPSIFYADYVAPYGPGSGHYRIK